MKNIDTRMKFAAKYADKRKNAKDKLAATKNLAIQPSFDTAARLGMVSKEINKIFAN